jgi:hypothetical protein
MKKILGTLALALAVAVSAFATTGSRMVCEKTGVEVESCCCVVDGESMICTLTGERVDTCCCTPAG